MTHVRLSNDATTWSPYVPYAATLPWTLAQGDGNASLFAQFKDGAGTQSAVVRNTIVLDTTGPRSTKTKPAANATDVAAGAKKVTDAAGNGWDQKKAPGRQPLRLAFRA